ncbi:hypothetical protein QQM79_03460 [Marinobacteraceae bacterium S3BR75-40.1]
MFSVEEFHLQNELNETLVFTTEPKQDGSGRSLWEQEAFIHEEIFAREALNAILHAGHDPGHSVLLDLWLYVHDKPWAIPDSEDQLVRDIAGKIGLGELFVYRGGEGVSENPLVVDGVDEGSHELESPKLPITSNLPEAFGENVGDSFALPSDEVQEAKVDLKQGARTYNGSYDAEGDFGILNPTVEDLNPPKLIDAPSGHDLADEVLPGGTGRSLSGHGAYFRDSGTVVIPDGTYLTSPRPGMTLDDEVAGYMERDDWLQLSIQSNKNSKLSKLFAAQIEGMTTWLPGAEIPNYQFFHPAAGDPIKVYKNSTTIRDNMPLSNILEKDQGRISWVACTQYYNMDWFS